MNAGRGAVLHAVLEGRDRSNRFALVLHRDGDTLQAWVLPQRTAHDGQDGGFMQTGLAWPVVPEAVPDDPPGAERIVLRRLPGDEECWVDDRTTERFRPWDGKPQPWRCV